jgi:hypothetical protein
LRLPCRLIRLRHHHLQLLHRSLTDSVQDRRTIEVGERQRLRRQRSRDLLRFRGISE